MYSKLKNQFRRPDQMCTLKTLEERLETLLSTLKSTRYDTLDEKSFLSLSAQVEHYFRFTRKRVKKNPKFKRLYYKAVAAKLGGEISHEVFFDPKYACFCQFIESNAFMHKLQTLKMKLEMGEEKVPMLRVALSNGDSRLIEWESMQKVPLPEGGYSFTYFNEEMFKTDSNFKLIDDYILTYRGITQYHPEEEQEIIAFDKRDPKEWNHTFVVEIWTLLKDKNGERPTLGIGDHCHIILKDKSGYVYSMGKFGQGQELRLKDYLTLFGPKKGRYICPDICSYYSETTRNLKKSAFEVTEEQFHLLFKQLTNDKKEKRPIFTILKQNCASYVQHTLKKVLNFKIDSELYLPLFVLRALIPKRLYNGILNMTKRMVNRCPHWLQKAFYFIPLLYIPTLVGGAVLRCFRADLTLKDILIHPWNMTIYSPIALRESLEEVSSL